MPNERLSTRLARMSEACAGDTVTLHALLPGLEGGDHALVTLLVALCFMHPVPMPGLSWGLAILVAVAGARMATGRTVWLPRALAERPLPARVPRKVLSAASRFFGRTERLIRPRGSWLASRAFIGAAIAANGALLLVPLPPPTNIPPAVSLLLLSLGALEGDGLVAALGYGATLGSATLLIGLLSAVWGATLRLAFR